MIIIGDPGIISLHLSSPVHKLRGGAGWELTTCTACNLQFTSYLYYRRDGRSLETSYASMSSLRGSGAGPRSNQTSRASKLSQLVKSVAERQEQRPVSSVSRSEQAQSHGARAHPGQQRTRGEEEQASFYSEEEDSEDDEDELWVFISFARERATGRRRVRMYGWLAFYGSSLNNLCTLIGWEMLLHT